MNNEEFVKRMGQRVKVQREMMLMTQDELARRIGYLGKSSISRIEKGETEIPQSKLKAFADALNTTIPYLMGWDERDTKEEQQLITYYRNLNRVGKDAVLAMAKQFSENPVYSEVVTSSVDVS